MLRGFDFEAASPIAPQAPGLNLKGATLFAAVNGQPRYSFDSDYNNFQPRVGFAWHVRDKWVIRGGYGLTYLGEHERGAPQGFSRTTPSTTTIDNLTPAVTLANPFANQPGGRLLEPIGASLGAGSFLGEGLNVNFMSRPLPYSHQYSFDIERELPHNFLVEAGYAGNTSRSLPAGVNVNVIPSSQLGRRLPNGQIDQAWYNERVPSPM